MMTYHKDITQKFVKGFTLDYVCHFPDGYVNGQTDIGASYLNMNTFSEVESQPSNEYWMRILVTDAITFNDSITDGVTKHKRVLVFADFSIFWPNSKSSNDLISLIEPTLDSIFLNLQFRGEDDSEIISVQEAPKDVVRFVRAQGENKWNEKTIRYPFEVRYV